MSNGYKFQKILAIKETEKLVAQEAYLHTVNTFEDVAKKLYHILKQKEDLEQTQINKVANGLSIQELRHHQQFIQNLDKSIVHYQRLVQSAREQMVGQEEILLEKNIEVKKYEKMKEKEQANYISLMNETENTMMDDISIQQFMNRRKLGDIIGTPRK